MRKSLWLVLAAFALMMVPAQQVEAQVDIGVQVPYNTEITDGALGIGGRLGVGVPLAGVGVQGDFNWYFPDEDVFDGDFWEIVANAVYTFPTVGASPYFGAGLAYQTSSSDVGGDLDETGFNILGGVQLGSVLPVNAFGELSYRIMNDFENQFVVGVGLLF